MKLCSKHPKYQAKRKPRANCGPCHNLYVGLREFLQVYPATLSVRATLRELGWTMRKTQDYYRFAVKHGHIQPSTAGGRKGVLSHENRKATMADKLPPVAGRLKAPATPKIDTPKRGVRRFLLSSAQNNTLLHEPLWQNLQAMASEYGAEIILARLVYNRFARAATMDKKLLIDNDKDRPVREYVWDKRLEPYFKDYRLELAPGLVWCGETNILPTAANPLTGLEGYTGRASMIIPHTRIAMRSVCSLPSEGTKFMYTTGTLTQRNYIQRKAGQLAEFHHCYAALLVEVDSEGTWFCRQINADSDGTLHDLDMKVEKGHVTRGNRVEAITWGDIHVAYGDPVAYKLAWGQGGILDTLRPKHQFMHDLIDFRARNPHTIQKQLHGQAFLEWVKGHCYVEKEMEDTAEFLTFASREWCKTVVVDDNHGNFLTRWVTQLGDFRKDPGNAVYFLEAALHFWKETQRKAGFPNMVRWAMDRATKLVGYYGPVRFLDEDESFIICPDAHGGIECGLHGHEGFNGARGGPTAFAKLGRKINAGHVHSTGIWDGSYFAGIMGSLNQGYNTGLGSWSQSNIITYPNGKRAIFTLYDGKWRA